jgi:hypothetical protein
VKSGNSNCRREGIIIVVAQVVKRVRHPRLLHLATHGYFLKDRDLRRSEQSGKRLHGLDAQWYAAHPLLRSGLVFSGANRDATDPRAGHGIAAAGDGIAAAGDGIAAAGDGIAAAGDTLSADDATASAREFPRQDMTEDGYLTALEAQFLDLEGTELVVLSACETGLGVLKSGEGVHGLQRSLQLAGARNILMSLWKVDDAATGQLMTRFYDAWLAGFSPREALRAAQDALRRNPDFTAPVHWGAFVLITQ